jgi:hypothetical protein
VKLQAHHHDYDKPLEVSWYCQRCHNAVHKELGRRWKEWAVTQEMSLNETPGNGPTG